MNLLELMLKDSNHENIYYVLFTACNSVGLGYTQE